MFDSFKKWTFDVVAADGSVRTTIRGVFTGEQVAIPQADVDIRPGDQMLRRLPSGLCEVLQVVRPRLEHHADSAAPFYRIDVNRGDVVRWARADTPA
ncbi:MAG TPA: hypothetical protein VIL72_04245 [Beijerinckiaceae bacterium]